MRRILCGPFAGRQVFCNFFLRELNTKKVGISIQPSRQVFIGRELPGRGGN